MMVRARQGRPGFVEGQRLGPAAAVFVDEVGERRLGLVVAVVIVDVDRVGIALQEEGCFLLERGRHGILFNDRAVEIGEEPRAVVRVVLHAVDGDGVALGLTEDAHPVEDALEPVPGIGVGLGHRLPGATAEEIDVEPALEELVAAVPDLGPAVVVARVVLVEVPALREVADRLAHDGRRVREIVEGRDNVDPGEGDEVFEELFIGPVGEEIGGADHAPEVLFRLVLVSALGRSQVRR